MWPIQSPQYAVQLCRGLAYRALPVSDVALLEALDGSLYSISQQMDQLVQQELTGKLSAWGTGGWGLILKM